MHAGIQDIIILDVFNIIRFEILDHALGNHIINCRTLTTPCICLVPWFVNDFCALRLEGI